MALSDFSDKQVIKEVQSIQHQEWLNHPYTRVHLKQLADDRAALLLKAENLSTSTPRDVDTILNILVKTKTLRETIEYAQKIR
jgi:hypothetical protein